MPEELLLPLKSKYNKGTVGILGDGLNKLHEVKNMQANTKTINLFEKFICGVMCPWSIINLFV